MFQIKNKIKPQGKSLINKMEITAQNDDNKDAYQGQENDA